jgi:hypothetical protein
MGMQGPEVSRVGELVLVWLLTRAEGKGARSGVASALKPLTAHRWSAGEWNAQLDAALGALEAGGLLERTARKGLGLTREGRARALKFLGLERAPKELNWKKVRLTYLTAHALGLPASQKEKMGKAGDLRAVLVQKQMGLGRVGERSLKAVQDELCWKQLGVTTDKPFTLTNVQSYLLGQLLQSSREVKPGQALEQLAARQVGARRTDADSLRQAAIQSWLLPGSEPALSSAPATGAPAAKPSIPPEGDSLSAFAERVMKTARALKSGRYGEDRVFISHVWQALGDPTLDEHAFKQRLLSANQKRLLSLSRADMVEWMEPKDVSSSEIRYLGSTFHFIAL